MDKSKPKLKQKEVKRGRGRPRKFADGKFVGFNVRLHKNVWESLYAYAEKRGVPMADLARDAIGEWLLATKLGQRPIAGRVAP